MRLVFLILIAFAWSFECEAQNFEAPRSSHIMMSGKYLIRSMSGSSNSKSDKQVTMPRITPTGDTLSAIVEVKPHANNKMRVNFTQYFNQTAQLSHWMGDMTIRDIGPKIHDLYLGTVKIGRIDHDRISLDFVQENVAIKDGVKPKGAHMEGVKQ